MSLNRKGELLFLQPGMVGGCGVRSAIGGRCEEVTQKAAPGVRLAQLLCISNLSPCLYLQLCADTELCRRVMVAWVW